MQGNRTVPSENFKQMHVLLYKDRCHSLMVFFMIIIKCCLAIKCVEIN
jgi:hypothetical protein